MTEKDLIRYEEDGKSFNAQGSLSHTRPLKILIAANTSLDGGMSIHLRSIQQALSSFSTVDILDDQESVDQGVIEKYDFVIRYGWNSNSSDSYEDQDFTKNISRLRAKNILCCCFDMTLLADEGKNSIQEHFGMIWYDSTFSAERGQAVIKNKKFIVVNPGILDWQPGAYCTSDTFKFLHVSNSLYRVKGLDIIEKSFRKAFAPEDNVHLTLVVKEKGDFVHNIKEFFKNRTHQIEIVTGSISHDDMWKLYFSSDCYVCASRTETFGLPVLEAATAGIPVIAHRHGGMRDYIDMVRCHEVGGKFSAMPPGEWRHNRQSTWFEPCFEDLSRKMKLATASKEKFPAQSEFLRRKFSSDAIAITLQQS